MTETKVQQAAQDKRTASQRIDDLENGLMSVYRTVDMMARDLMVIKDAIKLLGNKSDSMVKAANSSEGLTDANISKFMVENNVIELKEKVDGLVTSGTLVAAETITANSFVVGSEQNEDGTVNNPRLQFLLEAVNEDVRAKILGSKVGDLVSFGEGKLSLLVNEIYNLAEPKAEDVPASESEA